MSDKDPFPIFDSLAHPTISGSWLGRSVPADFETLGDAIQRSGFGGACAIGLDGIEGYSHEAFIERCKQVPGLIPIAGFNPQLDSGPEAMQRLRDMGYVGIKIHPRFSGLTQCIDTLSSALRAAGEADLTVFFCTYMHCELPDYPTSDLFLSLVSLLQTAPATRVILVHGGDVQLMRYAELVRFNPNLLLDLSLTIMKYEGSSLDLDIAFLFRNFDRRICVGTDWPEYTHDQLRIRFENFSHGLAEEKILNIAYKNIVTFLKVENEIELLPYVTD